MSRVGKNPVAVPSGVTVSLAAGEIKAKGKLGELAMRLSSDVEVKHEDNKVWVKPVRETKQARKSCPSDLVRVARRKLDQLNQAVVLGDLRAPPSNRLEQLKGEREGQYSIRINDQWRVCFRWAESGVEDVEIVDYH